MKRKSPKKRKYEEEPSCSVGLSKASPSKVAKVVTTEHSYANKRINVNEKLQTYKKQVKALKQQVQRKNKKIKDMEELLKLLKKEKLLLDDQCSLLEHNFSCVTEQLFQNEMRNATNTSYDHHYTDEIKQFAVTLHYYSPKAYEYVQKILALPHTSSIRAWAASVDYNPGYLMNVIRCLGSQVQEKPWMSEVVLIVDTTALHKGVTWDPKTKRYTGTVDYGTAMPEVTEDLATEALVFMISGLSGHFKHPIAYVLQDKCSSAVQAQLIKDCICLLFKEGINVVAVVFDGCYTNQSTATKLGCKMNVSELKTSF